MLKRLAQSGFSLVEIILVMALTSLLLVGVFSGTRGQRRHIQFSDSMERLKADVLRVKSEAFTVVDTFGCDGGRNETTDPSCADLEKASVLGKLIEFRDGSDEMRVYTIKLNQTPKRCHQRVGLANRQCNGYEVTITKIPWGTSLTIPGAPNPAPIPGGTNGCPLPVGQTCVYSRFIAFSRNVDGLTLTHTFDANQNTFIPGDGTNPGDFATTGFFNDENNWNNDSFRGTGVYEFKEAGETSPLKGRLVVHSDSGLVESEIYQ